MNRRITLTDAERETIFNAMTLACRDCLNSIDYSDPESGDEADGIVETYRKILLKIDAERLLAEWPYTVGTAH